MYIYIHIHIYIRTCILYLYHIYIIYIHTCIHIHALTTPCLRRQDTFWNRCNSLQYYTSAYLIFVGFFGTKSSEQDFTYLYWTMTKILFWDLFSCERTYMIDWVGRVNTVSLIKKADSLQRTVTHTATHTATHCNAHCNTLQHTAMHTASRAQVHTSRLVSGHYWKRHCVR